MTLNKEIEKVVNILINDINRKREEYEAKGISTVSATLLQHLTTCKILDKNWMYSRDNDKWCFS